MRLNDKIIDKFLSTPSARRATQARMRPLSCGENFYPRPPRGGRRPERRPGRLQRPISIHALREEGDLRWLMSPHRAQISIHALREEGDLLSSSSTWAFTNFYPRPPRGGRQSYWTASTSSTRFLSTPSARRATARSALFALGGMNFYPRPPRGGRPLRTSRDGRPSGNFYPRPPRGGRPEILGLTGTANLFLSTPSARRATCRQEPEVHHAEISIHALREEGDIKGMDNSENADISIHALREEGDPRASRPAREPTDFYPRPPRGGRQFWQRQTGGAEIFLSTPSARRATKYMTHAELSRYISIHALREEGDSKNRDKISIFKQIIQHSARI